MIKMSLVIPLILILLLFPITSLANPDEDLKKRIVQLEEEVKKLRKALEEIKAPKEAPFLTQVGESARKGESPYFGGYYSKPFLERFGRNTFLGGYGEVNYFDVERERSRFDLTRFIPFIYSNVSKRVKLASEIEFEHGGVQGGEGEAAVEFGIMDYLIKDWINLRGGIILTPLGKLNLVHDSPLQDVVDRPLVDQFVIPSTFRDVGVGFFGSFFPTELLKIDYEFYVMNGMQERRGFRITPQTGTKAVAVDGWKGRDINDNKALVGRVALSPLLGIEIGISGYRSAFDEQGEDFIQIGALDWAFQRGPWEFLGEYAIADIDNPGQIDRGIFRPEELEGFYAQVNYHFLPKIFKRWASSFFTDESIFTLSLRYDDITLNRGTPIRGGDRDRWTLGINFRPTEDTVFKLNYQFNDGKAFFENRNGIFFGIATYF